MENKGKAREHGITLVALVITIIILLILAGVAITALTQTGLFEKAKEAKEKTINSQEEEQNILNKYQDSIDEITGNVRSEKDNIISTKIADVKFKAKEVNGKYIGIEVEKNDNAKGYIYILNNKVVNVSKTETYFYENLDFNRNYQIKVIAIDEDAKLKDSEVKEVKTLEKQYLFKEGNEFEHLTGGYNSFEENMYNEIATGTSNIKNENSKLLIENINNNNSYGYGSSSSVYTNKTIDKIANKLVIEYNYNTNDNYVRNIFALLNSSKNEIKVISKPAKSIINNGKEIIDLLDIKENFYIKFKASAVLGAKSTLEIVNVYFTD